MRKKQQHIEEDESILQTEPDDFFHRATNATYEYLLDTVELDSTRPELLLMQSLQGRAIAGNWSPDIMRGLRGVNYFYPNTTLETVFEALGKNVAEIQEQRQSVIDDIKTYFNQVFMWMQDIQGGNPHPSRHCLKLTNAKREPLGTIKQFGNTLIRNPEHVLTGAYIGSCMDSATWRTRAEQRYGIRMHKGICRPVHLQRLRELGVTLKDLANSEGREQTYEDLKAAGVVSEAEKESYKGGYVSGYVELQKGPGISDDAAFLGVALTHGLEAAFGLFLLDAIDTWDKSTPKITRDGQDETLGKKIKEKYESLKGEGSFPCTDDDITAIIYLAAINGEEREVFPSCSQRRFLQVHQGTGLTALESHLVWTHYIKEEGGKLPPPMRLAYQQVNSHRFYDAFKRRYDELAGRGDLRRSFTLPNNGNGHQAGSNGKMS